MEGDGCRVKVQEYRRESKRKGQSDANWHIPCLSAQSAECRSQEKRCKARGRLVYVKRRERCNNKDREKMVNVGETVTSGNFRKRGQGQETLLMPQMKYLTLDSYKDVMHVTQKW